MDLKMQRQVDGALVDDDQLTDHFWVSDFRLYWPQGTLSCDRFPIIVPNIRTARHMANQLELIWNRVGPIRIVDCLRPTWAKRFYEKTANKDHHATSFIDSGVMAVDLMPKDMTAFEAYKIVDKMMDANEITQGGLGRYQKLLHYDTRSRRSRWEVPKHQGSMACTREPE